MTAAEPTSAPIRLSAPRTSAPAKALRLRTLACCTAVLLTACGGSDDAEAPPPPPPPPPPAGTVVVGASLGAIVNGAVSVSCPASGATLGTAVTGSAATVTVNTLGSCSGPVMVSISGAADGSTTYFDEALGRALPLPAGVSLRALLPTWSASLSAGVTPLTEAAVRQALALSATPSAAQVSAANAAVVSTLLGSGSTLDILALPGTWDATRTPGTLGNTAADRYALVLAALAHLARTQASPAVAAMTTLATDLADGVLHGNTDGLTYTPASLPALLRSSLNAMAAYATPELQAALGIAPPVALAAGGFSPAHGPVATQVTITGAGFDPDPFHMLVKFANNLAAEVVSSSATTLVVKVPANAVTGPLSITNTLTGETVATASSFTVDASSGGGGGGGGETWVSRASPSGFLLNGLAWGSGRFVAVGFGKTVIHSADGLSWTASQGPADNGYYDIKSVTYTGNQFVMVGDVIFGRSEPPLIATSPDGLTWTRRNWTPGAIAETALGAVATGGGRITAVGLNGTVVSSTDNGATWALENQTQVASFHGLAGNDTVRVAVGRDGSYEGRILFNNGSGWQTATGLSGFYPRAVAWTGQFVAVGSTSAGLSNAAVATSPDGATWTVRVLDAAAAPAGHPLVAVLRVGDAIYATGDNASNRHIIVKSVDGGATWSLVHQAQVQGNAMLAGIASSGGRIVTVGGVKSVTLP